MRIVMASLLMLLLGACAAVPVPVSADGPVTLAVEPRSLSPGDSLTLVLKNDSPGAIFYNLCPSVLERRARESWERVPSERMCTLELRRLQPGQEVRYPLQLPPSVAPGEYRYAARIEDLRNGTHAIVRSGMFLVNVHD
jgi:hypothetical protein